MMKDLIGYPIDLLDAYGQSCNGVALEHGQGLIVSRGNWK